MRSNGSNSLYWTVRGVTPEGSYVVSYPRPTWGSGENPVQDNDYVGVLLRLQVRVIGFRKPLLGGCALARRPARGSATPPRDAGGAPLQTPAETPECVRDLYQH